EKRPNKELNLVVVESGSYLLALLNDTGDFLYLSGPYLKELGYKANQLTGIQAQQLIHPADLATAQEAMFQVGQTRKPVNLSAIHFKAADGQWQPAETRVSNQLENPANQAVFISSPDATQRNLAQQWLVESEHRFQSLFKNNPDMVLFQNEQGAILDANISFLSFINRPKAGVINHFLVDFILPEMRPLLEKKLQEAFLGSEENFVAEVYFEELGHKVLEVVNVPLLVREKVVAVHTIIKDITAATHAQRDFQKQAKKLNTIFESITDAFFTLDKNWNITFSNSEFDNILSVNGKKYLGRNVWEIFPEEVDKSFYQNYYKAVETGHAVHFESFYERNKKWLEVKAFPSEEGLSVYFSDISEKVAAKKELEKLSLVASKTINGVLIMDAEGRIEWLNESFTQMTGYTLPEMLGKKPIDLFESPEKDNVEVQKIKTHLKKGGSFNSMLNPYCKSGEAIWISNDTSPVYDDAGNLTHFISIQKDISSQKEAESHLMKMSQDLYEHNRDLQQFTYIISHNLRSPVASALGLIKLMVSVTKESPDFDISLNYLNESISRLDDILKDINLSLSTRDKKNTLITENINVAEACRQVLEDFAEPLRQCNGQVLVNIAEGLLVKGNRAYIYSIFYNLLSNAIKYRSEKRPLQVSIKSFVNTQAVTAIHFSDNGSGFDRQKAGEDIFKMYKRFHPHKDGKGIGLFLVKMHLEAMGGYIEVNSQVDIGTSFTIYLN
ncbi:MAG: hypothetical protein JWQ14_3458, partial [Adhaeribacter sp.]|nr:hypothetical protein [Adhaeribacter sp.]